jgi:hypothetical protein
MNQRINFLIFCVSSRFAPLALGIYNPHIIGLLYFLLIEPKGLVALRKCFLVITDYCNPFSVYHACFFVVTSHVP